MAARDAEKLMPPALIEKFEQCHAVTRAHIRRLSAWLLRVPTADRTYALSKHADRWRRELAADLTPIVGATAAASISTDFHSIFDC